MEFVMQGIFLLKSLLCILEMEEGFFCDCRFLYLMAVCLCHMCVEFERETLIKVDNINAIISTTSIFNIFCCY